MGDAADTMRAEDERAEVKAEVDEIMHQAMGSSSARAYAPPKTWERLGAPLKFWVTLWEPGQSAADGYKTGEERNHRTFTRLVSWHWPMLPGEGHDVTFLHGSDDEFDLQVKGVTWRIGVGSQEDLCLLEFEDLHSEEHIVRGAGEEPLPVHPGLLLLAGFEEEPDL
jgi:hypothetical protein